MRTLLAGVGALLIAAVLAFPAAAQVWDTTHVLVSPSLAPTKLPREGMVPARLGIRMKISDAGASTPELKRLTIEYAPQIQLKTDDLPSCPLAELYGDGERPCADSVIGSGRVISEVTLPGQEARVLDGRLVAYFNQTHRQPRVLARVVGEESLPLTYVIPFVVRPASGKYDTALEVRSMRRIVGKCTAESPNCLAQPYALKGVYGHISHLSMTLGKRFVEAGCPPAPEGENLPLMRVSVKLIPEFDRSISIDQICRGT